MTNIIPKDILWPVRGARELLLATVFVLLTSLDTNAEDTPPKLSERLFFTDLEGVPCMMRWSEADTLTVGAKHLGYVVTHLDTIRTPDDVPESESPGLLVATLTRGDQTLKLERGKSVNFTEYYANFASTQDVTAVRTMVGDTFVIDNRPFKFLNVDPEKKFCTVVDTTSGETLLVGEQE